eukprot:1295887-Amphidinium_carterae.1
MLHLPPVKNQRHTLPFTLEGWHLLRLKIDIALVCFTARNSKTWSCLKIAFTDICRPEATMWVCVWQASLVYGAVSQKEVSPLISYSLCTCIPMRQNASAQIKSL